MRILFAGTPSIAVPSLEALFSLVKEDSSFELKGIVTNPDKPRGRKGRAEPSDIASAAERMNEQRHADGLPLIPVFKAPKLDSSLREQVAAVQPDLLVSFAYGRLFGPKFLALFPQGGINIHPSLLPRYRGPSPLTAAILNRDSETGISIQRLALEMDSGPLLMQERFPLNGRETTASLGEKAAVLGADMLIRCLYGIEKGELQDSAQADDEASYCSLISSDDAVLDWTRSALDLDAAIRAYTPWPLCRCEHEDKLLYVLEAEPYKKAAEFGPAPPGTVLGIDKSTGILVQTGDGILVLKKLQYRAKKALVWNVFLNGARNFVGSRLY